MRRQKIIKNFGTPEEVQPETVQPVEVQPEQDQMEEEQPVEEKELDIFKELIFHELTTLKALHLLSDFVDKINKNRKKQQVVQNTKQDNEKRIKRKYLDKYPILKHLVTEYGNIANKMDINPKIVDNLSVREEMLIILYGILDIPSRCKKLENKLT